MRDLMGTLKKRQQRKTELLFSIRKWKKNETKCDFRTGWKLVIILILLDYVN